MHKINIKLHNFRQGDGLPYFPHYKAALKSLSFSQKTTVRIIIRSALYGLILVVTATVVRSVAE